MVSSFTCNDSWGPPLADIPENRTIAIWTVGLRETPTANSILTAEQAKQSVELASGVWEAACGIRFVHAGHSEIVPESLGLPYFPTTLHDIKALQSEFHDPNFVISVYVPQVLYYDPTTDMIAKVLGLSAYPWDELKSIFLSKPCSICLAHQLAHYFGLEHQDDSNNLLAADNPGIELHPNQCKRVKEFVLGWRDFQSLCRPYAKAGVSVDSDVEVDFSCGQKPDF